MYIYIYIFQRVMNYTVFILNIHIVTDGFRLFLPSNLQMILYITVKPYICIARQLYVVSSEDHYTKVARNYMNIQSKFIV